MNLYRKNGKIAGALYIACTVSSIVSILFLGSLNTPNYLVNAAANESQIWIGILVQSIWALTTIGIPVMLFPILKKHSESLAQGFFSLRLIEGIFEFVAIVCQLSLLTLSKGFVIGALDASYYLASGTLSLAARDWGFWVANIFFALSALILNYGLYRSKFVPRWLSVFGLVGALIYLSVYLLNLFGFNQFLVLAAPLALQEMVFAVWLIVKGFNSSAIASESARTELNEIK